MEKSIVYHSNTVPVVEDLYIASVSEQMLPFNTKLRLGPGDFGLSVCICALVLDPARLRDPKTDRCPAERRESAKRDPRL